MASGPAVTRHIDLPEPEIWIRFERAPEDLNPRCKSKAGMRHGICLKYHVKRGADIAGKAFASPQPLKNLDRAPLREYDFFLP